MSDFNSSLPVRTESAGDIIAKIADATTPGQQLAIDSSGKITAKLDDASGNGITSQASGGQRALDVGINVSGTQVDPRSIRALTSSDVVTANQGSANTAANGWPVKLTDGTNTASVTAAGELKVDITQPIPAGSNTIGAVTQASGPWTQNLTQVGGSSVTLGQKTSANSFPVVIASDQSSIPVTISGSLAGTAINDYKDATAIAAGSSDNHDYTVTAGKTLALKQIVASASGKAKMEVQIETGVGTGTFTSKFVQFNSTGTPNMEVLLQDSISVAAGVRVRVIMSNRDLVAQDLYSTISGQET